MGAPGSTRPHRVETWEYLQPEVLSTQATNSLIVRCAAERSPNSALAVACSHPRVTPDRQHSNLAYKTPHHPHRKPSAATNSPPRTHRFHVKTPSKTRAQTGPPAPLLNTRFVCRGQIAISPLLPTPRTKTPILQIVPRGTIANCSTWNTPEHANTTAHFFRKIVQKNSQLVAQQLKAQES